MRSFSGMVVVITGASAGIGRALAVDLAARGARLVLAARRLERLEELDRELGGGHLCVRADVGRPEDCAALVARAHERFGRIDTLVCNAGYGLFRAVGETTAEEWRAIVATNLFGTTDCIRAALPLLAAQPLRDGWRGQVMIVSSCLARRAVPFLGAYSATKAAQLSLAEALRVELRSQAIAVTSVHPVGTASEFTAAAERHGGQRVARGFADRNQHTSAQVARHMARAIARPRPEAWPSRPARWAFALGGLLPRAVDWIMARVALPRK